MRIIYDVGANMGDNLGYYLQKADRVVAIEANPGLTDLFRHHFADEIASGRLAVETCVVAAGDAGPTSSFYLSREHHVLSQLDRPPDAQIARFEEVRLPCRNLIGIIDQYGPPHYVKIDIEHYDQVLLRDLFAHGVTPDYISAEAHSAEVFAALVELGGYDAFKLVDGPSVPQVYRDHSIATDQGPRVVSFPDHCAGPYGNDIPGPWRSAAAFQVTLDEVGLGWKDIHASRVDAVDDAPVA